MIQHFKSIDNLNFIIDPENIEKKFLLELIIQSLDVDYNIKNY